MAIATSGAVAERIGGATVIRPGVDAAHWAAVPAPPRQGPPRALWLGALAPWKRADLALEIAARIPELRLDARGRAAAGRRRTPAALRERAERPDLAGRVRFLGAVADPRDGARRGARACCTAPTASRSGSRSSRRSRPAGRSWRPPRAVRWRSSPRAAGGSTSPATPQAGAEALLAVLADAAAPAAARARAGGVRRRPRRPRASPPRSRPSRPEAEPHPRTRATPRPRPPGTPTAGAARRA